MILARGFQCVVVAMFVTVASTGHAALFWTNTNANHLWDDPGNWNGAGVVPTATDDVNTFLANGLADYILIDSGDVAVSQDFIVAPEDRNTRIVVEPGGSLQFRNMFLTIFPTPGPAGVTGEFEINGGTVSAVFDGTFGGKILMGGSPNSNSLSKVTQNGGVVDLDVALEFGGAGGESLYELKGGVLDAKYVSRFAPSSIAKIDMSSAGGTLVLDNFGHFTNDLLLPGYISIDGIQAFDINDFSLDFDTYPDRVAITAQLNPPIAGDFDGNGVVDGADLTQWQGDYGVNGDSDADGNGTSDGLDFLIWQRNFGSGSTPSSTLAVIPEPSSVILLLVAFSVLAHPSVRKSL